ERDVGHGLAEDRVKHQQIVDRCTRIADGRGKWFATLHRKARAVESQVERNVSGRDGARRCVRQQLSDREILEVVAAPGLVLGHWLLAWAMAAAMARVRRAISACSSSTMRPSTVITPLPWFSGSSRAARILRANATSASCGANTALAVAI